MDTLNTYCLRSYGSYERERRSLGEQDVKIWEAALATMVTPTFFDPIKIGSYGTRFVNGGLGANNPIRFLLQEARDAWTFGKLEDTFGCIVSVGSGQPSLKPFGGEILGDFYKDFVSVATDSEKEAYYFPLEHPSLVPPYFRFNVVRGLEDVRLEEWRRTNAVMAATLKYVTDPAVRPKILECGNTLEASRIWPWSNIEDLDENYATKSFGDILAGSPAFSDSGYYSTGSSLFKLKIDHAKAAQDLFDLFVKDSELEPLYPTAIREIGQARFQKNFILLLNQYCGGLRLISHTEVDNATLRFMKMQVRPIAVKISHHFKVSGNEPELAHLPNKVESEEERVKRVNEWSQKTSLVSGDLAEQERVDPVQEMKNEDKDEEEEEQEEEEAVLESPIEGSFGYSRDFLVSGEPFNNLRKDFWRFVVQEAKILRPSFLSREVPSKVYVRDALNPWFPSDFHKRHKLTINIYWEVLEYLKKELEEGQSLKAILTLSGAKENAFAATCTDYLDFLCLRTSQLLLEALLDALEVSKTHNSSDIPRRGERLISLATYKGDPKWRKPERAELILNGTPEEIVEIVHQTAWLGLVFQSPISGELSHADFTLQQSSVFKFDLTYSPVRILGKSSDTCWHPLFTGFVLAYGFPIPNREKELGVELNFNVMTSLAGSVCPVMSDGGYALRGFSTIIYPVSQPKSELPESPVQWHALHASNNTKLPLALLRDLPRLKLTDQNEFEMLASCRTFLGYSDEVTVRLGTRDSEYDRSLRPHGPSLGAQRSRLEFSGVSTNLNASHYVGFGVSANWLVNRSKATEIRDSNKASYEAILSDIMDQPSVLYDVEDRRGWLVPTICVILHMIHVRALHWAQKEIIPNLDGKVPFAKPGSGPSEPASRAARRAIMEDFKDLELYVSMRGKQTVCLSAWVTELWAAIDAMRYDIVNDRPAKRAGLVGWDFFDVATQGTACGERRETKAMCKANWKDLIIMSGIVVFHGIGYGEVIKSKTEICSVWHSVPTGQDLLVACIESVEQLQHKVVSSFASVEDFKMRSNAALEWPKEDSFFCDPRKGGRCFRRVHKLGQGGKLLRPIEGSRHGRGAVIFGDTTERTHPSDGVTKYSIPGPDQAPAAPLAVDAPLEIAPLPVLSTQTSELVGVVNGNPPEQEHQGREQRGINSYLVEIRQHEEQRALTHLRARITSLGLETRNLMFLGVGIVGLVSVFMHGLIIHWFWRAE